MGVVLHRLDKQRQSRELADMLRSDYHSHHFVLIFVLIVVLVIFILIINIIAVILIVVILIFIAIIVTSIVITQHDNVNNIGKQFGIV